MKAVFLFPGQGAQFTGMGTDFIEAFPETEKYFYNASQICGFNIQELCARGPEEKLAQTRWAQPAIFAFSWAVLSLFRKKFPSVNPVAAAGLSLGEYTAAASGGVFSFEEAMYLVRERGQAMEEAGRKNTGTMASIIGLTPEQVTDICKDIDNVWPANFNSPAQVVISGAPDAVESAGKEAEDKGAKRVITLKVGGAFHTPFMEPAVDKLKEAVERTTFNESEFPIVSNAPASGLTKPQEIKDALLRQLVAPVRWVECVEWLAKETQPDLLIEFAPGKVLKGLIRRIDRNMKVVNIATPEDLENFGGE